MKIRSECHFVEEPDLRLTPEQQEKLIYYDLCEKFTRELVKTNKFLTTIDVTTKDSRGKEKLARVTAIVLSEQDMQNIALFMRAHCTHLTPIEFTEFWKLF